MLETRDLAIGYRSRREQKTVAKAINRKRCFQPT